MIRPTLLASILALAFSVAHAAQPLQLKVYNADGNSFNVNSVLISGEKDAIVIDAGFTRADAYRIAANVLDSGKQLKTIYISQADPDYYFGAEVLKGLFPQAEVLASPAVLDRIKAKLPAKVGFWSPKMGANAPQQPLLPSVYNGNTLTVDGEKLEIRGLDGALPHRPYVWVPSLRAIVGNIGVFGGLHVWTADTQQASERKAWLAQLDEMAALKPAIVVPCHMKPGTALDAGNISYTSEYLKRFEQTAQTTKASAELIEQMKKAYPQAGLGIALDIGAKVNKGDMKW